MTLATKHSADRLREILVSRILGQLSSNRSVLLLLSGGSTAPIGIAACRDLEDALSNNSFSPSFSPDCLVSLVDERFGPVGHLNSNWNIFSRENLPWKNLVPVPVLTSFDNNADLFLETTREFDGFLSRAVARHNKGRLFIAGIFGIGVDGHTAGILPDSPVSRLPTTSDLYAIGYHSYPHTRITMTPSFFPNIDLAMVWASGPEKKRALEALTTDYPYNQVPAQLLKLPRETIIHTDQEVSVHEEP